MKPSISVTLTAFCLLGATLTATVAQAETRVYRGENRVYVDGPNRDYYRGPNRTIYNGVNRDFYRGPNRVIYNGVNRDFYRGPNRIIRDFE